MADQHDDDLALVDGANVAHSTEGGPPRLRNILLICEKLREEGLRPIVVADASLRHEIDERGAYEKLVDAGEVKQAPAGTDADYFILSFARELDAAVVSNDRFRDRAEQFPEARERIIRYMIVADEVVLERRARPRDRKGAQHRGGNDESGKRRRGRSGGGSGDRQQRSQGAGGEAHP